MRISKESLFKELYDQSDYIIQNVRKEFNSLSPTQLMFKPSPKSWSIVECFNHLNISCRLYHQEMEEKLKRAVTQSHPATNDYRTGLFGNFMVNFMSVGPDLEPKRKVKTTKTFIPAFPAGNPMGEIDRFILSQQDFRGIIEQAKQVNLNKVKINTPVTKLLKFNMGDAMRFITAHNLRHIAQARRVMRSPDFPETVQRQAPQPS